ncbi:hypothetical protein M513_09298 [Trichuris suis]|uniref:ISXO2-like transposase domain-containing protein n=1 Tax=Trichuris suis TaxID=68888 RepID=A0A085LXY5_9BILA|nr:hypothetical protein M513_09298 [Trichuris suis]
MTLSGESSGHPPRWRCHKAEYRTDVPLRRGTIFEELDKKCAVAWRKRLRDVAAESVLSHPRVIGGPGQIVEVDATLFSKKKSHRGNRSSRTLIPLIRQYIRPGTTVISDCWRGCRGLSLEDYTHLRVNHSINFLHPDQPEVHTQSVESLRAQVKRRNKARCRTRRSELDSYFWEFMWRRRVRSNEDPFDKMLGDIATYWAPIWPPFCIYL